MDFWPCNNGGFSIIQWYMYPTYVCMYVVKHITHISIRTTRTITTAKVTMKLWVLFVHLWHQEGTQTEKKLKPNVGFLKSILEYTVHDKLPEYWRKSETVIYGHKFISFWFKHLLWKRRENERGERGGRTFLFCFVFFLFYLLFSVGNRPLTHFGSLLAFLLVEPSLVAMRRPCFSLRHCLKA